MTARSGCVGRSVRERATSPGRSGGGNGGSVISGVCGLFDGWGVRYSKDRAVLQSPPGLFAVWLWTIGLDRLQCPPTMGGYERPAFRVGFPMQRPVER